MQQVDPGADENRQLRRTMRDLIAVSALPAIWIGLDPEGIARSLADALMNTLSLDMVYVRMAHVAGTGIVESLRTKLSVDTDTLARLRGVLEPLIAANSSETPTTISNLFGSGELNIAITRFGVGDNFGALITACGRPGFPSEQDRLLLGVGANQTAIVFRRRRAEAQTIEERERLRVTLSSIGDAVITTDINQNLTYLNPVAERLTGWSNQEAAGQPLERVFVIFNEITREPATNPIARVLREGVVVGLANHTVLKSRLGREIAIEDSAAPIRNVDGEVCGAVMVFHDVTARRSTELALQQERRVLELLNDTGKTIASTLDLRTVIQTVTDAGTQLSGANFGAFFYNLVNERGESYTLYTLSGAQKESFDKFGLPRNTPVFAPTFTGQSVVRSPDITKDPRYGTMAPHYGMPKGHLPVRSYLAAPVISRSGEVIGGLFFGHSEPDMFSERVEKLIVGIAAQAAIAIDNARLYEAAQKEIKQRKHAEETINAAREEAERANRAKDEFLAIISHELRTPLTSILGWARMLKGGTLDPATAIHGIAVIERNVSMQTQLIEDLLDVSRIITGKLSLTISGIDILKVIRAAVDSINTAAVAKKITLHVVTESSITSIAGDFDRLQQVFWNILSNAVKFTPTGGRVEIRLQRVDAMLRIVVSDNGKGIQPSFLPHVFERFRQDDSTNTRSFGGLGLGLAIVRHLVEQHGGTIRAESAGENKGSTFTVELPIRELKSSSPDTKPDPAENVAKLLSGMRLVIVEDDPDSRDLIATILTSAGASITALSNADDALAAIRCSVPDVLISDIGMPLKNGYDLIKELRARSSDEGGRIPALALTAYAREEERRRAIGAGFDEHVPKPIDPRILITSVSRLLNRKGRFSNRKM